jgi:hypothetical protein
MRNRDIMPEKSPIIPEPFLIKATTGDTLQPLDKLIFEYIRRCVLLVLLIIFVSPLIVNAQTTHYSQFWNEILMNHAFKSKWVAEMDLGSKFSTTPTEKNPLKTNIQRYITGWAHFHLSSHWKFSSSLTYYYNKYEPEIEQSKTYEWRVGLQSTYYFHKIRYSLSTRMRAELRLMGDSTGIYEDVYRYRQQIKFQIPFNSKSMRKGVVYLFTSDEVFFKSTAKSTGFEFFDRNRFTLGTGYLITDDIQVELAYVNEYLPRTKGNQVYNDLSLTFTFNNLVQNLRKSNKKKAKEPEKCD